MRTALAGETYLSDVKEPVHETENNVMYRQIPWTIDGQLVSSPKMTSNMTRKMTQKPEYDLEDDPEARI